ncbi:uncharacterized protein LOC119020064 isoform X2 [Acanthopagrus latus]|uniref:uncharacterized protein LOC119020064 isoform X2 n=1 Tax=Acanthopagrus latus TaxID=8177 RepID=UPI00187C398D|nr:uncharacterized protein LOC119020064 isoform X2 [Acanthopagrus latus]
MDRSKKRELEMNFQAANPTVETDPATGLGGAAFELLEDSGNRRQIINQDLSLHVLSDSMFSEQQKLKYVLDWTHSFLSSGSEVRHKLCRADGLISADGAHREAEKISPVRKHSSAAEYHHPVSRAAGGNEVFGGGGAYKPPFSDDFCVPFSFIPGRDELTLPEFREIPGNMKHVNLPDTQTASKDKTCRENSPFKTYQRKSEVNEEQDSGSVFVMCAKGDINIVEPERTREQTEKSSHSHLEIPPKLSIYEQYQLCVDQLHHLRIRQQQHIEPAGFIEAKERKASEEMAAPVEAPTLPTSGFECIDQKVAAAETTNSDSTDKNQDRSKYKRSRAMLTEQGQTGNYDNSTMKEKPAAICALTTSKHLDHQSNKSGGFLKRTAGGATSTHKVPAVEERAALTPDPGFFPKRLGCDPNRKGCQSRVKGGRGASLRLCEKPRVSLSPIANKEISQRPRPSGVIKHTKRLTPEDKVETTSACSDTHKYRPPTRTRTALHECRRPTTPASTACRCEQTDCRFSPAGVPVCPCWLSLPDEVWLSILSLLPHSDLCTVLQVCSRLHTLATDHTLWKDLRIENCVLTERWLLCVSRRRPRSLCLYSCSAASLTSAGLEMFFTLCGKTLEELKVTSCTGPCLHGDQMLALISRCCDRVTRVDVSWSGATDTGVKALSDGRSELQLKSVVLNGCHVSDDPLTRLVMRHKESLCRLEVFGCQFLTPSCLQAVFEVCPHLEHLNIGQVTDATVDTLLQNCVKLQRLTLNSCPGVTDLTLHSISKYTPYIRSLDVSGCKTVTDAGVRSLALGCRRLEQLDLSSTGTGNRGVTLLANYCGGHLQTVKLSFCHITRENILKLCRRCKRLKVLHLYGCTRLPTEREIRGVNAAVKVYPLP